MSTLDPNVALTELTLREDDFSAQFSLGSDPHFWIRVEMPCDAEVVITDFNIGVQAVSTSAALLAAALRQIGAARCKALRLCDVASRCSAVVPDHLNEVIDTYVALERRFIERRDTADRSGKLDLRVIFAVIPQ